MSARRLKGIIEDNGIITAIAIDKDRNSQHALKWAVENVILDSPQCVILHVELGDPGPHLQDDMHDEAHQIFLPFRGFCARKGLIAKEIILRDHDIPNAIVNYITNNSISNLVVGAAKNTFLKKFLSSDVATTLLKTTPETCAVFVVSKGKLLKSRLAIQPQNISKQQDLSSLLYNHERTGSFDSIDSDRESYVFTHANKTISEFSQSNSVQGSPPRYLSEASQSEVDNGSYGVVSTVNDNGNYGVVSTVSDNGSSGVVSTMSSYTMSESSTTTGSSISSTSAVSIITFR
ncbi:hypothetical protein AALP_AA2G161500 [Arabis alpina]|uniref:RING-type E3 ubiquitin transferase n=1 Tax=Arabis alpina TaxID=50452 RepID=A0A087HHU7_ARAAL|nr:hypothetical protein AALP_AA2G161500 [Arabis alpina]